MKYKIRRLKLKIINSINEFIPGRWIRAVIFVDDLYESWLPSQKTYFLEDIKFSGTYIILSGAKCLYVGESINVGNRLKIHFGRYKDSGIWNEYKNIFVAIRKEKNRHERLMIEARFIERFKPKFNKKLVLR